MKNLFSIDADIFALYQQIENNEGEITPEIEQQLEITETDRKAKAEGYSYIIKQLQAESDMLKAEAKRLQEKAKAKESLIDRLKDNLLRSVTLHGNIKTDLISVSSRKTKSVQITDEAAIPAEFLRIKTEPNKTAIKDALEAGEEVHGALIVENFSLMIK